MKILLVHNYYSQRGGEDSYFDNLTELLKKKNKVILYTKSSSKANTVFKKIKALKTLVMDDGVIRSELIKLIEKYNPDVVHINNIYPLIGPSIYELFNEYGIPIIQTIHNYRLLPDREESLGYDNYRSRLYKIILRSSIKKSIKKGVFGSVDCFVFPTLFAKKTYNANAGFEIKNSTVIPNFAESLKMKRPVKKSDYFLFAGRFSREKGIIPLLDIFAKLPLQKLIVIGDGPQKKQVLGYRRYKNIKILGWADRRTLFKYILRARAVISPSIAYEVMPLGVIESLTLGTRVIVPGKGAYLETVKNRLDAVFFKDNDFDDLNKKIISFDDKIKIKTNYSELYSAKKHYSSLIDLYRKLLKHKI